MLAERCGVQGIGVAWIEPLRAHRQGPLAEDRQGDGPQFGRVAVQPPAQDAGQACAACLQRHEVTDAGLVLAAAVVDHQDVTGFGAFDGLEEDVHTAVMPGRTDPAHQVRAAPQGDGTGRGAPDRNAEPHAGVGHVRGGEVQAGPVELFGIQVALLV
ncbi:MAG: hypothetical protein JWQ75_255 [Pseudarthrobacter sp.]|nr:hypothetical protein [Pseudarthrobacter sp.]